MTNNYTATSNIISKALEEISLSEKDVIRIDILSSENDILDFVIETEWNTTECCADLESTMILGILTTPKTIEELLGSTYTISRRANHCRKAA